MKKELLEELRDARQIIEAQAEQIGEMRKDLEAINSVVVEYEGEGASPFFFPLAVRVDRLLGVPAADLCNYGCSGDEAPEDVKPQGFHTAL